MKGEEMKPTNNAAVVVTVGAPLLRPGLTISAAVSFRYAEDTGRRLLDVARAINAPASEPPQ